MKYELWFGDNGYSFFPEDNESARRLLGANAELIWTVEATTWDEARAKQHAFLGWEPYKQMGEYHGINRPEHIQRFESAFRSPDPAKELRQLAILLRDEGVSQIELYDLFAHFQRATSGDDPRYDVIVDNMDPIWGEPYSKGWALYATTLSNSQVNEYRKKSQQHGSR